MAPVVWQDIDGVVEQTQHRPRLLRQALQFKLLSWTCQQRCRIPLHEYPSSKPLQLCNVVVLQQESTRHLGRLGCDVWTQVHQDVAVPWAQPRLSAQAKLVKLVVSRVLAKCFTNEKQQLIVKSCVYRREAGS